jgi:hypothetical protein
MNANWFRKLVSDEIREMLMWAGLADNYHSIKTKEVDSKGKTFYRLKMNCGEILVYSNKALYVNSYKCHSVNECKRHIQFHYVEPHSGY